MDPAAVGGETGGMSQIPGAPQDPTPASELPPGHGQQAPYGQQAGGPPGHGQPVGGYAGGGAPVSEMAPAQQRLWGCLAHLSPIATALLLSTWTGGTVPLGFLGPLVIFLVLRDRGVFVRRQSVEALNFQILLAALTLVVVVIGGILTIVTLGLGLFAVVPVVVVLAVIALVFQVIAAVKAYQGVDYRYPLNWRPVK